MHRTTRDEEFSEFVLLHRLDFVRTARLLAAGDVHQAEDLVQTALVKAYVAWPQVQRAGSPVAYVRRSIVNAHIDETRRPFWRRERSVAEPPEPAHHQAAPDSMGDAVRSALAALPPRMRAVVVLRHWLDLSVEQCAEMLGCSPGTVKSQNAKATAKLRQMLTDEGSPRAPDQHQPEPMQILEREPFAFGRRSR